MTDIEMLPLPKWLLEGFTDPTIERLCDYARANVAHATAAKDAEIEALRAEVAAWRELSDHVRAGACNAIWPDRYTDARTRDVAAALKRAERLADLIGKLEATTAPSPTGRTGRPVFFEGHDMRYTAETYSLSRADGTAETGWCVKHGDDAICDVRTREEAERVRDLLNKETTE